MEIDCPQLFRFSIKLQRERTVGDKKMLHFRLDPNLKAQATQTSVAMRLATTDAVRLLFLRVVTK